MSVLCVGLSLSVRLCWSVCMFVSVFVTAALLRLLPPPSHQECEYLASYSARHQIPEVGGDKLGKTDFDTGLCISDGTEP